MNDRTASSVPARFARAALIALLLFGTGCAPIWVPIDDSSPRPFPMTTLELEMDLPQGWMSAYYMPITGAFLFSKHGRTLEEIWVRRRAKSAIVKGTNRSISDVMTIQDVANLFIDSRRLDDGVGALQVLSNVPTNIQGQACYRLEYRYRDSIGLSRRAAEYGCPVGAWIYRFEFIAPNQHYFDQHLPEFEEITQTIRFTGKGS